MLAMTTILCAAGLQVIAGEPAAKDTRVYEMRTYYAPSGRLDDIVARFRNHTVKLFEKHGITNIGYWVPIDNPENKLVYIIACPSREARDESFKKFGADPEWKEVVKKTEANGRIVTKIESVFLTATDYSPAIKPSASGDRVFELRTYTAAPGRLDNLNARFRNHTLKLFEKHGMTNIGYWVLMQGQPGAESTLVYMLAHKSEEAAKKSFDAFRKDTDWVSAKKASEKKAGGSLTVQDGVKSVFMRATDFSALR
jgi:hypothetical protein